MRPSPIGTRAISKPAIRADAYGSAASSGALFRILI